MSTRVPVGNRIVEVDFVKTASGGWQFTWGHNTFVAWKDPAGFEGRNWCLYFLDPQIPMPNDRVIDDNLASRAECVESAIDWSRFH